MLATIDSFVMQDMVVVHVLVMLTSGSRSGDGSKWIASCFSLLKVGPHGLQHSFGAEVLQVIHL